MKDSLTDCLLSRREFLSDIRKREEELRKKKEEEEKAGLFYYYYSTSRFRDLNGHAYTYYPQLSSLYNDRIIENLPRRGPN